MAVHVMRPAMRPGLGLQRSEKTVAGGFECCLLAFRHQAAAGPVKRVEGGTYAGFGEAAPGCGFGGGICGLDGSENLFTIF